MQFFIDTADVDAIRKANDMGLVDGVTTNPSLIKKAGKDHEKTIREIASFINGPISVETLSDTAEGMLAEANKYLKWGDNIVIKIVMSPEGMKAVNVLADQGIPTNVTVTFSAAQALIAAKAGATFVSPFVGRLDDIGHDGMHLISQIRNIYDNYGFETQILVASVRHPIHLIQSAQMGADVATVPPKTLMQLFNHPLTDTGFQLFRKDLNQMRQISSINFNKNLLIDSNKTLFETLVTLQKHKGAAVAISKNNKLAGIFTTGDLNRLIKAKKKFNYNDKIINFISKNPYSVDITDKVEVITNLVKKYNLGQFVVLDQDRVLGILDVRDLL